MRLEKWPTINRSLQLDKATNGQARGGSQIRKVRSFWSNGFSASIILPDRTLRPGRKLQGKVVIHSKALVTFAGLRVQLDAQCTLFLEKNGELVNKRFSILHQQTDSSSGGSSGGSHNAQAQTNNNLGNNGGINGNNRRGGGNGLGIHCEAVESLANSKEIYALIPDFNSVVDALTFPFSLEVPGDRAFPCPFSNSVGSLVYKLTAHFCSQDMRYAQIAEETLDFRGYTNLSINSSETTKPISIERPLAVAPPPSSSLSSIASSSSAEVTASFKVEATGFLTEEAVHFTLHVKNPKRLPMHMKVFIAQKVTYGIAENCWKKVTSSVVRCERVEVNLGGSSASSGMSGETGELVWRGALIIPKGQVPTFSSGSGYPSYGVSYTIQFKVEGLDHDWSLKGSAPFYIGTCRNNLLFGRLITTVTG